MTSSAARELVQMRWGQRLTPEETQTLANALILKHGGVCKAALAIGKTRQTLTLYRRGEVCASVELRKFL